MASSAWPEVSRAGVRKESWMPTRVAKGKTGTHGKKTGIRTFTWNAHLSVAAFDLDAAGDG